MDKIILPEKVQFIIQELLSHGYEAYAVGGCIRDSLLGRVPEDWDITTLAMPEQVKGLFPHTIDTGLEHGTVTVMLEKEGFEVTTYRIDGEYEDGRHPKQVEFTRSLKEDLRRRDFTINALAYNDSAGIVDLFDGMGDLQKHIIRCVGNADDRFHEDALRIMRAVRFSAQLDFSIEADTLRAVSSHAPELKKISAERIRTELTKLLMSAHPERILTAYEAGLTAVFLPEFDRMMDTPQENIHHIYNVGIHSIQALLFLASESIPGGKLENLSKKDQAILRYAALLHDIGKPDSKTMDANGVAHFYKHAEIGAEMARAVLLRLKFDNETIQMAEHLIRVHDYRYSDGKTPTTEASVRRAIHRIGEDSLGLLFLLQEADLRAQNPALLAAKLRQLEEARELAGQILAEKQCVSLKNLAVNGVDLLRAGFPQGKEIGAALSGLLDYVLEHPEDNQKDILLERALLLRQQQAKTNDSNKN